MTTAETFIWYKASPRLQLGVAHLWKQNSFRWLASYQFIPETASMPSLSASAGVQGIGTGNPGYSVTAEKNWAQTRGTLNAFAGVGFRSNESHSHGVFGIKWADPAGFTIGVQADGHNHHPFVTYGRDQWFGGIYLINGDRPALMLGTRF